MENELNENDNKLLAYCHNRARHLSDIARHINIDVKNVSVRLSRLKKLGLINIEKIRNKVYVRSTQGDKTSKYFYELLKSLEANKGEMKQEDFISLIPYSFEEEEASDKFSAPLKIMYTSPPLVEHIIRISKHGKEFLKDFKL